MWAGTFVGCHLAGLLTCFAVNAQLIALMRELSQNMGKQRPIHSITYTHLYIVQKLIMRTVKKVVV